MSGALFVSVRQAAELLGISDDTVYDLIHTGDLPSARFNTKHMVPMKAIELVLETAMAGFDPAGLLATLDQRTATTTAKPDGRADMGTGAARPLKERVAVGR